MSEPDPIAAGHETMNEALRAAMYGGTPAEPDPEPEVRPRGRGLAGSPVGRGARDVSPTAAEIAEQTNDALRRAARRVSGRAN